jgi:2'-5' RNA ligase
LVEAAGEVRLTWQADRLVLYKSLLGRGPARYEALAEVPLRTV